MFYVTYSQFVSQMHEIGISRTSDLILVSREANGLKFTPTCS